jgi:hypothetical protein
VNRRCKVCGTAINVHDEVRGGLCRSPECRRRYAGHVAKQEYQERRDALRGIAEKRRDRLIPPGPVPLPAAAIPSNDRDVVPLPEERRAAFAQYVRSLVERVFADPEDQHHPLRPAPEGDPLSRAACALCRGHCCLKGGPHNAYIDATTIERVRAERPGADAEGVLAAYLTAIPPESFDEACVYQSATGCVLAENLRATICGTFFCDGLGEFRIAVRESGATRGFGVAFRDDVPVRQALLTPEGPEPV